AGLAGQQRREVLDAHAQLAAEATADAGHDHTDPAGRRLEDLGQRILDLERQLRVGPHGHLPGGVPGRYGGPRFRVALVDHRGGEAVLEDPIGLGPAALDVPGDDAGAVAHIAVAVE